MSIICLICKDKLLNNSPGSSIGSLSSLIENPVVVTGCGHLYHFECLQSWFRTQKKKLQNQGIVGVFPDQCPTCQTEVHDEQTRRIYLLEDHREALERAKLVEKTENLEIYCRQLENHVQRLQHENDLLLNKALAPQSSNLPREEFDAIVKNDRVIWMKKDSPPLSGVVLSIFKKDAALWVKLKLDKKIRTNNSNQRSGLLGSFRFDKKQDWTVPFEEIVLEKDFRRNIVLDEYSTSEPSTPTIFQSLKMPSFRNSTLSLPGEYMSQHILSPDGLKRTSSNNYINNSTSSMDLSKVSHSTVEYLKVPNSRPISTFTDPPMNLPTISTSPLPVHDEELSDDQREYVIINHKTTEPNFKSTTVGEARTAQDGKSKHVTFAEEVEEQSFPNSTKGNHFRDHDYKNVSDMVLDKDDICLLPNEPPPPVPERPFVSEYGHLNVSVVDDYYPENATESEKTSPSISLLGKGLDLPVVRVNPSQSLDYSKSIVQAEQYLETLSANTEPQATVPFNSSCFDITFAVLFHGCDAFDDALLFKKSTNDQLQQAVQNVLKDEFVVPFRQFQKYNVGYAGQFHSIISHLCSSYLDLEELMTILFEYVFKMPPFISYSYDMCDYIHQFFIDFTDKTRKPTTQQLFERSLSLQDNLKLRTEPSPALFLQMPNSDDGIIHYEAVIPSLSLNIEKLVERDTPKTESQTCYCNKIATLECATCAKIHGKSPVLFCEDCSVLLEAIHDQMYHKLELIPIKALDFPNTNLELAAVICLTGNVYSTFIRDVHSHEGKPRWTYISGFDKGKSKVQEFPNGDRWVESISSDPTKLEMASLDSLKRKLVSNCRMMLYLPMQNSYA